MRSARAFLVLGAFFAFTFPLMPLQLLFLWTGSRYARTFPHWYHRQVCKIAGIRLHIEGRVAREQGVLIISNHVSWLDITVLSAVAPVSRRALWHGWDGKPAQCTHRPQKKLTRVSAGQRVYPQVRDSNERVTNRPTKGARQRSCCFCKIHFCKQRFVA